MSAEVDEIQELYLSGKKDEAGAKIPTALIEELSLIGPKEKIRDDLAKWRESIVTTLLISGDAPTLSAPPPSSSWASLFVQSSLAGLLGLLATPDRATHGRHCCF